MGFSVCGVMDLQVGKHAPPGVILSDRFPNSCQRWLTRCRSRDSYFQGLPSTESSSPFRPPTGIPGHTGEKDSLWLRLPLSSVTTSCLWGAGNDSMQVLRAGWYRWKSIWYLNSDYFIAFVSLKCRSHLSGADMIPHLLLDICSAAVCREINAPWTLDGVLARSCLEFHFKLKNGCRHYEQIRSSVLRLSGERRGRRPLLTCFTWVRMTLNLSQTSVWLMRTPSLASQREKLLPRFVMTEVADNRWSTYSSLMWEQRLCQNISLRQSERQIDYTVLGIVFPTMMCRQDQAVDLLILVLGC